jgi:hypothetical protein
MRKPNARQAASLLLFTTAGHEGHVPGGHFQLKDEALPNTPAMKAAPGRPAGAAATPSLPCGRP